MTELLTTCQQLVVGLLTWAWGLVVLVSTFCWDLLSTLHVSSPRLEGLLVGGVFNHDAFAFVPKMATAGTWVVWIQVGDLSSNQVTVELTGGGD